MNDVIIAGLNRHGKTEEMRRQAAEYLMMNPDAFVVDQEEHKRLRIRGAEIMIRKKNDYYMRSRGIVNELVKLQHMFDTMLLNPETGEVKYTFPAGVQFLIDQYEKMLKELQVEIFGKPKTDELDKQP